jgi:hypothetical protein
VVVTLQYYSRQIYEAQINCRMFERLKYICTH